MDRRSALKQLAILGGGIILAPSCTFDSERLSVALDNLNIIPEQEKLLAQVVNTIIPATDIPGGKELKLHQFVLIMVDDCRGKEEQKSFVEGLKELNPLSDNNYGKSFSDCDAKQREDLIAGVLGDNEQEQSNVPAVQKFLSMTKRYAIQGFLTSEYIMTEVLPYKLVPGSFDGCVKIS